MGLDLWLFDRKRPTQIGAPHPEKKFSGSTEQRKVNKEGSKCQVPARYLNRRVNKNYFGRCS